MTPCSGRVARALTVSDRRTTGVTRTKIKDAQHCGPHLPQRWLDVYDGRAVDGFDRPDSKPVPGGLFHGHGVESERIRPVLGACGENASQTTALVVARVNLEDVAAGLVKPRHDDDLVSRGDTGEAFDE